MHAFAMLGSCVHVCVRAYDKQIRIQHEKESNLDIFQVIDNMFEDLTITLNAHRTEHNHNWNLFSHIRQGHHHRLPKFTV